MRGLHLIADLHDCRGPLALDDATGLRDWCCAAVARSGLVAVRECFHPFVDAQGRAQGVTGVVLLAESHLAVHTWPELGAVTADLYVCNLGADNRARAEALMARLVRAFDPGREAIRRIERGLPAEPD